MMWDVQRSIKDLPKGTEDDCTPLIEAEQTFSLDEASFLCVNHLLPSLRDQRLLVPLPRAQPKLYHLLGSCSQNTPIFSFLISLLFSLPTVTQFSSIVILFYTTSSYILTPANSANVTLRKFMTIALFQNISYSAHNGIIMENSDC